MKYLLFFTSILFSTVVFSQKDMSIDIVGSFDYTNTTNSNQTFTGSNTGWKGIFTYRAGANFNFRIFEKVMFKTGFRYANLGDSFFIDDLRWPSEIGPNGFQPDPSLPRYINSVTKHRFIEVPLIFRYEINNKKFAPYFEVGLAPHIYINTKSLYETNLESSSETSDFSESISDFNKLQIAAVVGFGVNYKIRERSQLFAQPTLRYNLHRISDNPNDDRLISIGIEFGYRMLFGSYFNKLKE